MRALTKLALGVGALTLALSASANAEYFNRYDDGNWTNAEYEGGGCHYYYSINNQSGESHVNRYGDCSNVVIGPDGRPMPVVQAVPVPVEPD